MNSAHTPWTYMGDGRGDLKPFFNAWLPAYRHREGNCSTQTASRQESACDATVHRRRSRSSWGETLHASAAPPSHTAPRTGSSKRSPVRSARLPTSPHLTCPFSPGPRLTHVCPSETYLSEPILLISVSSPLNCNLLNVPVQRPSQ